MNVHGDDNSSAACPLRVSVVIPARNEAANIGRCINSIRTWLPYHTCSEIIVCDHGSTDATRRIAIDAGAVVIEHQGGTVGNLRNIGAASTHGDAILFLDADVELTPAWGAAIALVLAELKNDPLQIVGSICEAPPSDNIFMKAWFARLNRADSRYLGTAHMLTSRSLFERLAGFDARLVSGEDVDICNRAVFVGARIRIIPTLRVIHYDYPTSVAAFLKREIWHGTGDFASLEKFRKSRVAMISVLVLIFVTLGLAALMLGRHTLGVTLLLAVLLLTVISSFAKFSSALGILRLANIAIFFVYLLGRGLSGVFALVPRRIGFAGNGDEAARRP